MMVGTLLGALAAVVLLSGSAMPDVAAQAQSYPPPRGAQNTASSPPSQQPPPPVGVPVGAGPTPQAQPNGGASSGPYPGQAGYPPAAPIGGRGGLGNSGAPLRLPGQNCQGFGQCAWGGAFTQPASCTPDARVCTSPGTGPDLTGMTCSSNGAQRLCSRDNGGLLVPSTLPSTTGTDTTGAGMTTGTGVVPGGQPGIMGNGTSSASSSPPLCTNC